MRDHEAAPRNGEQPRRTRRELLLQGLGVAVLVALPEPLRAIARPSGHVARSPAPTRAPERPYLDVALRAARWLRSAAITTPRGTTWAVDPTNPKTAQQDLYSGSPGVVLFLLELHRATGDRAWLELASSGADHLAASLPSAPGPRDSAGLYTGFAGIAYTLEEVAASSNRDAHRTAARHALDLILASAREAGAGVEWSETTDIISGSAGIGLYLVRAASTLGESRARDLAVRAGRRLLESEHRTGDASLWMMAPSVPRNYPNFSHGTAGVAYFMATLAQATSERTFLDAAMRGARYLQGIATSTDADGRRVFHNDPDGRDLYYLSWCHGPAGTARLFHRLGTITGDERWSSYVSRLARGTIASGVPQRSPGFWNNVSQCCGNCGVSDFFVSLHALTRDDAYLAIARRCADDTIQRATPDGDGLKWVQAEHRVRPELLVAQTGLMQGAAGVGLAMLRLDGAVTGRRGHVVLPDSPFPA